MLALARQVLTADGLLRRGTWAKGELTGWSLAGKVLGIAGAGSIGTRVGEMGAAWGMEVVGCVKHPSETRAARMAERGIRLASLEDVQIPNYEPRPVLIPATCEPLIQRAATQGMQTLSETERAEALFCQQQMLIRAQEEEAASELLEAHSEAARFVLQAATVAFTAVIAILAWVF